MEKRNEPQVADLEQLVADTLRRAREAGASAAEAAASFGSGFSANVRMREVESVRHQRDQGLSVTVWLGQRRGSASTSDLRPAALAEAVTKACALARHAAEDPCAGLADRERLATAIPDLDLDHPWEIDPPGAIAIATACEAAALAADRRVDNSEGAAVSTSRGCRAYGNSNGFLAGYRESEHSISCAVLASEGGQMETDYEYDVARDPSLLMAGEVIGHEAGRRTAARLGARKLSTRQSPVLFPARVARGLIGHLLGAIGGGALYRKASFLVDAIDSPVMAPCVDIDEQPHLAKGLASAPYDNEGVETRARRLVEAGTLRGYLLGSYYARKLGLVTTGNAGGAHNIIVADTGIDWAGLVRRLDRGLIVADLMGSGVNAVTGDYSRGAAGFWVENGEICHPVSEITIAGNLRDMYRGILGIGTDVDRRGGVQCGSILVEHMTIAGN